MNSEKSTYERAEIEIITFQPEDIIITSNYGSDDKDGWDA